MSYSPYWINKFGCLDYLSKPQLTIRIGLLFFPRLFSYQLRSFSATTAIESRFSNKEIQQIYRATQRYSNLRLQDIHSLLLEKGYKLNFDELTDILSSKIPCNKSQNKIHMSLHTKDVHSPQSRDTEWNGTNTITKKTTVMAEKDHVNVHMQRLRNPLSLRYQIDRNKKSLDDNESIPEPMIPEFSTSSETRTLIEDLHKSVIHSDMTERIEKMWKKDGDIKSDQISDVFRRAVCSDMKRLSRPVFVNDTADYRSPYMSRQSALRRIILKRVVRNAGEEGLVDGLVNSDAALCRLRSGADPPPELLEPLLAFHGTTRYSFDPVLRLDQKLKGIEVFLKTVDYLGPSASLESLSQYFPENIDTATLSKSHPFRNHLGFTTCEPHDTQGGITMGRPLPELYQQLRNIRYPTLQGVAHNLPNDPIYRELTVNAIRLLERNEGWSHGKKLRFINSLKGVFNNLGPAKHYERLLDAAMPKKKKRYMITQKEKHISASVDDSRRFLLPLRTIEERKRALELKRKR